MEESNNQDRLDLGDARKLFLGGLNLSTNEDTLRNHFSAFGVLEDVVIMREPLHSRSRGFAFVRFSSEEGVENALTSGPHIIDNRKIEPKRAVARGDSRQTRPSSSHVQDHSGGGGRGAGGRRDGGGLHGVSGFGGEGRPAPRTTAPGRGGGRSPQFTQDGRSPQFQKEGRSPQFHDSRSPSNQHDEYAYNKIFVGGFHYETREPEVKAYFEQFGTIITAEVMINRDTGKSRGFGFVIFAEEGSAVAACEVPDHCIHDKVVEVKRAIPRSRLAPGTPAANIPNELESQILQEREHFQHHQHHHQQRMHHENAVAAFAAGYALPPQLQPVVPGQMMMAGPYSMGGGGGGSQRPRRSPTNYDRGNVHNNMNNHSVNISSPSSVSAAITPVATSGGPKTSSGKPGVAAKAPPSYAAALKGPTTTLSHTEKSTANTGSPSTATQQGGTGAVALQQQPHTNTDHNAAPPGIDRPVGQSPYSDPLMHQVGSSALNGEILPPESIGTGRAGVITKSSSHSNPPSRSNSLALPDNRDITGTPLANLPWLSSPPSNPLMAADVGADGLNLALPPAALEAHSLGLSQHNLGGGYPSHLQQQGSGGHWMDPTTQQQHAQMLAASMHQQQPQQQQQHMYGHHQYSHAQPQHHMMYGVPYLTPPPSGPADMWHHHQLMQQQQQQAVADHPGHHYPQPLPPPQQQQQAYMGHHHYSFFQHQQQPDLSNLTPQQMMFLTVQQQALQASYQSQMQQLQQYQNQLLQQYGTLQHAASVHHSPTNAATVAGTQQLRGPPPGMGDLIKPGGIMPPEQNTSGAAAAGVAPPTGNQGEGTERDDLFHSFNELHMESPAFTPSQSWPRR